MEAKQNSLFFNASDIFNLKPQLSRNTYKYVPTPKSTDNPHSSPITQDMTSDNNRNTISPSLHKQRRDITPKINAKRKLRLCNAKDKHCVLLSTIKDDEIVVDTAKEARAQRKRNIDKVHNDAVLLGTDSNNYVTTNEAYQQHAKRQLKKSKTLCILNKNANKNAITTLKVKSICASHHVIQMVLPTQSRATPTTKTSSIITYQTFSTIPVKTNLTKRLLQQSRHVTIKLNAPRQNFSVKIIHKTQKLRCPL